jgi:hypothetical protein
MVDDYFSGLKPNGLKETVIPSPNFIRFWIKFFERIILINNVLIPYQKERQKNIFRKFGF